MDIIVNVMLSCFLNGPNWWLLRSQHSGGFKGKKNSSRLPVKRQHSSWICWMPVPIIPVCVQEMDSVKQYQIIRGETEKHQGGKNKIIKKKKQRSLSSGEKDRKERAIKRGRNESKHYLFWRPPSPPRSSEKFLQFHPPQLNHKERTHSPISTDRKTKEKTAEHEGGRKSGDPSFCRLLLMATNLIICLHSRLPRPAPSLTLSL